jgi:Kef-type K+ transport system membrane component KefB
MPGFLRPEPVVNQAIAEPTLPVPGTRRRQTLRYLLLAVLPVLAGVYLVNAHSAGTGAALAVKAAGHGWLAHLETAPAKFMLQLLIVLSCAKAAGALVRRVGQPAVIGEMLAGILLGPSLFGLVLPDLHAWIFPPESLGGFSLVTQLGVLVFMFAAGAEFDLSSLKGQRSRALLISHAGIALPFLLGLLLALPLFRQYAPAGVAFSSFALFLGIALSITAFPVLLRILEDRGYTTRPIGRIAVACAALADATAWAMLGIIVAAVESSSAVEVVVRLAVALVLLWLCVAKLRKRIATREIAEQHESRWMLVLVLALFAGSLASEAIGLHALFGAFVAGIVFSSNPRLCRLVEERIEPFAAVLLVPLFFATTGLRTRIDLLTGYDWALCGAIVLVATIGKLGGTVLAARISGVERVDAWRLGALMNTRGLMELIVLGVGYDLGLIDRNLFAILVLVAIVTTVMTGRILGFIDKRHPQAPAPDAQPVDSIR